VRAALIVPIFASMVLAACGNSTDSAAPKQESPGTLVSQRSLDVADPALRAAASSATYIRYQSTSPAGRPIEVSGAVFLPTGHPPAGGWPVITLGHGTSGVVSACGPTNSPTLFGSAPGVAEMLSGHHAVVMTNYQGLDGPGNAPYVDSLPSGYDMLNAVRAAYRTGLPLAADTVIVGISQGGRAGEAAAETAKTYAPELKIHGVVLLSPALSVHFVDAVHAGALHAPDQYLILPYLVEAVRYGNPGFGYDRVLHGDLLAAAPRLESECTGQQTAADVALGTAATPAEASFADDAAANTFSDFESRTDLPKTATTLPTYIARGDSDVLVSTAWSNDAVAKMCALDTPVHDLVVPGGHSAPGTVADQWLGWIQNLFSDKPFVSTCRH